MTRLQRLSCFVGALCAASIASPTASAKSLGWNADTLAAELAGIHQLPELPQDVAELKFQDFFVTPVGPGGLRLKDRLTSLAGRRVRILGFMVRQDEPVPGTALLAPYSATTDEAEYGLCDDLPPTVVFVKVPQYDGKPVPFTPGPLLLTGRLEIGAQEEADGRVSFVRLRLDQEPVGIPAPAKS